ncbi:putative oxidoreductase [Xylariales sp. PMI_506]|nr:putative oxidoreductase [Xylariales sp. PMI_506]
MRVFITGSTGFVGTAVVKEFLSAGHEVLGLTRTDAGVEQLRSQGAEPLRGTLEDLKILREGASNCDAVIHLAFVHGSVDFAGACAIDRAAITTMGEVLAEAVAAGKGERALVITTGTMILGRSAGSGKPGVESDGPDMNIPMAAARGASEPLCLSFVERGVRAIIVRLPPTTHGPGSSGFTGHLARTALQKGVSGYIGDGQNRWSAGHRDDAARLYRLAAESAAPGSVFHAVAEEGVPVKDIATAVGRQLGVPVVSLGPEEAADQFGWFQAAVSANNVASSDQTRKQLVWEPTGPTVLEDVPIIVDFVKSQSA